MKTDINKNELKRKLIFALVMGIITTGIISFSLIVINLGFTKNFLRAWLKSWLLAYVFVIPAILFIAPPIERLVNSLVKND
ncbi:DUF2798 domain-containing protein [Winogradskyella sp. 3972H.M.0a.05]|uniref:DUF2798 domain-containing protein n=1 Tax=Winogradskyella sp. 3972H.M.0a.05 TaxID=2950277 RepID=UPI00339433C0